jgi:GNAT superfamily N-acetyltransferase
VSGIHAHRVSGSFQLRPVRYDSPDATALTEQAQLFYVELYGGPDATPFTTDEFAPPLGGFYVGYLDERPVAMGGWRFSPVIAPVGATRPAEIKRMFVRADVRQLGLARRLLAALEAEAQASGADWMILETGQPQEAAVALYRASGYVDIAPFGFYADEPGVVSLGKRLGTRRLRSDP